MFRFLEVYCVRTLCWVVMVSLCTAQQWLWHPEIRVAGFLSASRNVLDKVDWEEMLLYLIVGCFAVSNSKSAHNWALFAFLLNLQLCHCEPASLSACCLCLVSGHLCTLLWRSYHQFISLFLWKYFFSVIFIGIVCPVIPFLCLQDKM